jgi:hypothetical protein
MIQQELAAASAAAAVRGPTSPTFKCAGPDLVQLFCSLVYARWSGIAASCAHAHIAASRQVATLMRC